jgi:hypothetical protein
MVPFRLPVTTHATGLAHKHASLDGTPHLRASVFFSEPTHRYFGSPPPYCGELFFREFHVQQHTQIFSGANRY